ncbi:protein-glutamate O-methyltransferase CheR [Oceanicoccus sp. KOV_DT_Chl]|uniref:CheR family methyltransferase n=1 Tax=Oceanicoccus sp. KOV_DT_Chl TaxID=1904639 RepID=UPI000C7CD391|nr:protein-glutamate O-methyltransferase CheR [Oceanicoccus sp. KOV_DT_Chl]
MDDVLLPPSDETFILFQALIQSQTGIFLPLHKKSLLQNRLAKRLLARGLSSFDDYYQMVSSRLEKRELQQALELITTNETYFFREPAHFEYLKQSLLPGVPTGRPLRIWSAAASTGEEAYSIAMLLASCFYHPWEIFASDVNETVIQQAKKGIYLNQRTSGISAEFLEKYCRKGVAEFEGFLRIIPELRGRVNFESFNLMGSVSSLGKFNIIFLRNVMIYFDKDTQRKLLRKIAKCLEPNGWLFVSHSESLHGVTDDFYLVRPSIYRLKAYQHEH